MVAFGVPDPDAFRPGDEEVAVLIYLHSIGHAIAPTTRLLTEDAAVAEGSVGSNVVDADVSLFAVVNVKVLAIWRKSETVRLGQVLGE